MANLAKSKGGFEMVVDIVFRRIAATLFMGTFRILEAEGSK